MAQSIKNVPFAELSQIDAPLFLQGIGGDVIQNLLSEMAAGIVSQFDYFKLLFDQSEIKDKGTYSNVKSNKDSSH